MKKFIALFICINMLFGCGGMQGLQRKSADNLNKIIKQDNELYYNSEEGHTQDVEMFIKDKNIIRIRIPVEYNENIEDTPEELPYETNSWIKKSEKLNMECINHICDKMGCTTLERKCDINQYYVNIDLQYAGVPECTFNFVISTILLPVSIMAFISDPTRMIELHKCPHLTNDGAKFSVILKNNNGYEIGDPEAAGINFNFSVSPKEMILDCNKKYCRIVDENNEIVNKVKIIKKLSFNKEKIKELLIQEEKELKEYQQKRKQQKKECPGLYSTLYMAQQGYYIDPALGLSVAKKFEELHCGDWLNEQLSSYDY